MLRVGLLYNIKVIEETVKHHEELSNIFSSRVLFIIMLQAEFSPVNCPLSPNKALPTTPYPINCPCQIPSYEFKNHLRNIKYFLLNGNLDSLSNLCKMQQSNFHNGTTEWYA